MLLSVVVRPCSFLLGEVNVRGVTDLGLRVVVCDILFLVKGFVTVSILKKEGIVNLFPELRGFVVFFGKLGLVELSIRTSGKVIRGCTGRVRLSGCVGMGGEKVVTRVFLKFLSFLFVWPIILLGDIGRTFIDFPCLGSFVAGILGGKFGFSVENTVSTFERGLLVGVTKGFKSSGLKGLLVFMKMFGVTRGVVRGFGVVVLLLLEKLSRLVVEVLSTLGFL